MSEAISDLSRGGSIYQLSVLCYDQHLIHDLLSTLLYTFCFPCQSKSCRVYDWLIIIIIIIIIIIGTSVCNKNHSLTIKISRCRDGAMGQLCSRDIRVAGWSAAGLNLSPKVNSLNFFSSYKNSMSTFQSCSQAPPRCWELFATTDIARATLTKLRYFLFLKNHL